MYPAGNPPLAFHGLCGWNCAVSSIVFSFMAEVIRLIAMFWRS